MRVCIVGAGDAGAMAANQIRRLSGEVEIEVFSRRSELGCPPCEMPLVLSGVIPSWEELFRGFRQESFYKKRNIGLHLSTEVTEIRRKDKRLIAGGEEYAYDKLILATGSTPTIPPIPGLNGEREYTLSTDIADGRALQEAIEKYSSAAIVGAGSIGLEVAAALKMRGYDKVYLLARRGLLRAYLDEDMAKLVEERLRENGVNLIMPAQIGRVKSEPDGKIIVLQDGELKVDFIFFATGAKPNVDLALKAGLQIGETGAIAVNEYLQTSDPDIYAAGDCMENWDVVTGSKRIVQLATNALRTGYIAARNAVLGNSFPYEGSATPFITRIFGLYIGSVGYTERLAREKGLEAVSVTVTTSWLKQRFGGKPATYKLIADGKAKTLIGCQLISEERVSDTIDKLAVAISAKMPLHRLVQIDSSYSPYVQEDQLAVPLHRLIDKLG